MPVDAEPFLGSYANAGERVDVVRKDDGGLQSVSRPLGALAALPGVRPSYKPLVGYSPTSLLDAEPERGMYLEYCFSDIDERGHARHLFLGGRIYTRLADAEWR